MKLGKLNKEDEAKLRNGECPVPDCGSKRFFDGPHGGAAANIFCENGHRFWVAGPFTPEYQGQAKAKVVEVINPGLDGPDTRLLLGDE